MDSLPAGLGGGSDPVGTAPSLSSLMTPSKEEKELQQESIATGKEAEKSLKSSAAQGNDLAKHLGEAPDPVKYGLSPDDLKAMQPAKAPEYKSDNPLQDFGSIASLIGIFGGMRSRTPLVTSLNAASGAMKALHQRNLEDYDQQVKEWKNNTDYISKLMEWREKAYDIADKKFGDDLAAKSAAYQMISAASGDTMKADQVAKGNWQEVEKSRTDAANVRIKFDEVKAKIAETAEAQRLRLQQLEKDKFGNPTEVDIVGPDGKPSQILAQQEKNSGQWVSADAKRTPVEVKGIAGKEIPDENDPSVKATAKLIANYEMAPLTAFALRSPWGQAVMANVSKQNPDYDATQYAGKNATVTAFDKGKQGDTTRSLNVVVQHLDLVGELGQALNNGDVQTINRLKNKFKEEFGNADVTNFDVAKGIVGDEIVKATIGYAGGMADRQNAQNQLSSAKSWDQLAGVIRTAQGLAGGQLMGLRQQYQAGTGLKNFDDKYLMPETAAALEKAKGSAQRDPLGLLGSGGGGADSSDPLGIR